VISFEASEVSIKQEPWGDVVILGADEDSDPDKYLALQKKDSYDEQDIRLGINDVHIEVCGQGWGWYGNIAGFDLTRGRIFVQLSSEAAAEMEDDGKVEVTFLPGKGLSIRGAGGVDLQPWRAHQFRVKEFPDQVISFTVENGKVLAMRQRDPSGEFTFPRQP